MTLGGRSRTLWLAAALAAAVAPWLASGLAHQTRQPLPAEPLGTDGEAIFPVVEGWGPAKDGSTVILLGHYNRNSRTALDIPIGPDNRIEPGGPDHGQPTHFEPGQQHGVFAIKVPPDFGTNRLTWTITVNGQSSRVSFWLNPPYFIDFFRHAASGNQPPVVRFAADGPTHTGPPIATAQTLSGTVGQPVTLRLWASDVPGTAVGAGDELAALRGRTPRIVDPVAIVGNETFGGPGAARARSDPPDIVVNWHKYRGPGTATFGQRRLPLVTKGDAALFVEATTTASFSAPGDYTLRAQITDESGPNGGGDQCCWTTAHVKVTIK
ncbi:MAG: hypothetical protein ACT4QD_26350 [Acidobacteriota bacterium]